MLLCAENEEIIYFLGNVETVHFRSLLGRVEWVWMVVMKAGLCVRSKKILCQGRLQKHASKWQNPGYMHKQGLQLRRKVGVCARVSRGYMRSAANI